MLPCLLQGSSKGQGVNMQKKAKLLPLARALRNPKPTLQTQVVKIIHFGVVLLTFRALSVLGGCRLGFATAQSALGLEKFLSWFITVLGACGAGALGGGAARAGCPGVFRDHGLWGAVGASWDPPGLNPSHLVFCGHVKLALLGELVRVL